MPACHSTRPVLGMLAFTLAVGLATVATAQDSLQEEVQAELDRGQTALNDQEFATARDAYNAAIKLLEKSFGSNPIAYVGRALAHAGLDEKEKALADFQKAEQLAGNSGQTLPPEALYARGMFYLDIGGQFVGAALPDLLAAYESNDENMDYIFALGKVYALVSPQYPQYAPLAVEMLTKFLEANSNHAEGLRLRGQAYASMRKFEEAMADTRRSLDLEPDKHEAHFAIGVLEVQQENWAAAIDALAQSIEKYVPADGDESGLPFVQAYLLMASVHEEAGKASNDPTVQQQAFEHAIDTCNVLLEQLPEELTPQLAQIKLQALFRRGVNERLLEDFTAAAQSLTEVINLNPEFAEAYFRRAIVYTEMQEEHLALRDLEAAQALRFDDARAYLWEGITFAQMGEYRNAIRSYNEAISFSNRYVDAYRNRAHAYFQLEEYNKAVENFNECIRLQPEEPRHFYKRGVCYAALGKPERAERSYVMALEVDNGFAPAIEALVGLYQQSGRTELAGQYRQRLEGLRQPTPQSPQE